MPALPLLSTAKLQTQTEPYGIFPDESKGFVTTSSHTNRTGVTKLPFLYKCDILCQYLPSKEISEQLIKTSQNQSTYVNKFMILKNLPHIHQ